MDVPPLLHVKLHMETSYNKELIRLDWSNGRKESKVWSTLKLDKIKRKKERKIIDSNKSLLLVFLVYVQNYRK